MLLLSKMSELAPAGPGGRDHSQGWWHRQRIWVSRLWHELDEHCADELPATSGSRRARWFRLLWFTALLLFLAPIVLFLRPLLRRFIFHFEGGEKVEADARELWKTNPHEALALLKSVNSALREGERSNRLKFWRGSIEIPPYGRCRLSDRFVLDGALYSFAFALGDYETALAICSEPPPRIPTIVQQVDCLVAMRRPGDAIVVLQSNLKLDNRRGDLHRRLAELAGSTTTGLN